LTRGDIERLEPGACRICGYDITGTDSIRCPECGTTRLVV
jgi:predicted Zn-ribbon and HTH transcriptional regulator